MLILSVMAGNVCMTESFQSPPLHPERIRAALRAIEMEKDEDEKVFDSVHVQTFKAALELVRKGQMAVGLTGDVADAGQAALKLLATIQRLGK